MYQLSYNMSTQKFQAIRLKLCTNKVSSSFEDFTRAMPGQPKRRSRNSPRQNGGKVILQKTFHSTDVFYALIRLGFRMDGFFGSLETAHLSKLELPVI